jgi:hypothetical protein
MTPVDVRSRLIDALRLDLVGPDPGDATFEAEVLPTSPSRWYLNGFLVPFEAEESERSDGLDDEALDSGGRQSAGDDETTPDRASARKALVAPSATVCSASPPARLHPDEPPRASSTPPPPTARSSTCCSSPPAAARPRPTWASPPSPWCCAACARTPASGAGRRVLMRYTLRLLTLDQLGRAATLICALELERRQQDPRCLGPWPFEIGLWVGQAATPNRMGEKGDKDAHTARARVLAYQNDDGPPSPIPLESCPWCGHASSASSFQLVPNADQPDRSRVAAAAALRLHGANPADRRRRRAIYRGCRLPHRHRRQVRPAPLGRRGRARSSARSSATTRAGFYGPCEPAASAPASQPAAPARPDHPGRAAPDLRPPRARWWASTRPPSTPSRRDVGGRARSAQDRRLHRDGAPRRARRSGPSSGAAVDVFPPPGPDRRDSFFATTVAVERRRTPALPRRRRAGAQPQGRPPAHLPRAHRRRPAAWVEGGPRGSPTPPTPT